MSLLGDRLRQARERSGLNQIQVMQKTTINNKTLSRYENGGSEPDLDTLKILAELYEVSVDFLLGRNKKQREEIDELRKELIEEFKKLSKEDQEYVVGLIKKIKKE